MLFYIISDMILGIFVGIYADSTFLVVNYAENPHGDSRKRVGDFGLVERETYYYYTFTHFY